MNPKAKPGVGKKRKREDVDEKERSYNFRLYEYQCICQLCQRFAFVAEIRHYRSDNRVFLYWLDENGVTCYKPTPEITWDPKNAISKHSRCGNNAFLLLS